MLLLNHRNMIIKKILSVLNIVAITTWADWPKVFVTQTLSSWSQNDPHKSSVSRPLPTHRTSTQSKLFRGLWLLTAVHFSPDFPSKHLQWTELSKVNTRGSSEKVNDKLNRGEAKVKHSTRLQDTAGWNYWKVPEEKRNIFGAKRKKRKRGVCHAEAVAGELQSEQLGHLQASVVQQE